MSMISFKGKVVVVGNVSVGKTSIAARFYENKFNKNSIPSVGVSYFSQSVSVDDRINVKYCIWDTAGQERYRAINQLYYRGSGAAIIVYDITDANSFLAVKEYWINSVRKIAGDDIIIVLVGNKCDSIANRAVLKEEAESVASQSDILFFECSAKTGEGIQEIFQAIAKTVLTRFTEQKNIEGFTLCQLEVKPKTITIESNKKTKKCC
ncbi:hypothetical protein WA158_001428 [Blastocystis sp. Blastoise]